MTIAASRIRVISPLFILALLLGPSTQAASDINEIFSQLKAKAADKSYDIRIARENAARSTAQLYTAITGWFPRLDLQLTQNRSQDFSILTSGALGPTLPFILNPQALNLSRWELGVSMPLYQRSVHLGILQTDAEKDVNETQLEIRLGELDWRMRTLLGNYLLDVYKEAALRNSIDLAKNSLKEATLRFELGQKTRVDVLRAKASLTSTETRGLNYRQQRISNLNSLLEYTGLTQKDLKQSGLEELLQDEEKMMAAIDRFADLDRAIPRLELYLGEEVPPEKISGRIAQSSVLYQSYLSQQRLSERQAGSLSAREWPELGFRGAVSKQADTWSDAFAPENRSYSLSLQLTIHLFSGGSIFSTYAERTHAEQASELKATRDILNLRNEVESERTQIQALISSLESLKLSKEQNEEIVRLSFKSYQLGKATIVELLSSQDTLIDSKINLAKTKLDLASLSRRFAWNLGVHLE